MTQPDDALRQSCTECGILTAYCYPHATVLCPCGAVILVIGYEIRSCARPNAPFFGAASMAGARSRDAPDPDVPPAREHSKKIMRAPVLGPNLRKLMVDLVRDGARQTDIAKAMGISVHRVREHTKGLVQVGRKLQGAITRAEIIRRVESAYGNDGPTEDMIRARQRVRDEEVARNPAIEWSPQSHRAIMAAIVEDARHRAELNVKIARVAMMAGKRLGGVVSEEAVRLAFRLALVRAGNLARHEGLDLDECSEPICAALGIPNYRSALESALPLPEPAGPPSRVTLGFTWAPPGGFPMRQPAAEPDPDDEFGDPTACEPSAIYATTGDVEFDESAETVD